MTESERKSCVELRGELSTPLEHEERGRERKKDAKSVGLSDTGKSHCPLVCHPRLRRGRSWSSIDSYGTRKRGRFGNGNFESTYIYMVERTNSFVWSIVLWLLCVLEKFYSLSLFLKIQDKFRRVEWKLIGSWISSIEYYSRFTLGASKFLEARDRVAPPLASSTCLERSRARAFGANKMAVIPRRFDPFAGQVSLVNRVDAKGIPRSRLWSMGCDIKNR